MADQENDRSPDSKVIRNPDGNPVVASSFNDLNKHDSTPSVPLTDVQKVRWSELAEDLKDARIQAYIEANFSIQALKLLQAVVPMIALLA